MSTNSSTEDGPLITTSSNDGTTHRLSENINASSHHSENNEAHGRCVSHILGEIPGVDQGGFDDGTSFLDDESSYYDTSDDDESPDHILSTYSRHPTEIDKLVIYSSPSDMQPVLSSLQTAFNSDPLADLGTLSRLAVELVAMILQEMDVHSFFRFRQVNRRARQLSHFVQEYQAISKHALEAVRALLRTKLAAQLTVMELFSELLTDKCNTCANFGELLLLFTAKRCCLQCLRYRPSFRVLTARTVRRIADISQEQLNQHCLRLRTVPGSYDSIFREPRRRPGSLFLATQTSHALLHAGLINENTSWELNNYGATRSFRRMAATAFPHYDTQSSTIDRGVWCVPCSEVFDDMLSSGSQEFLEYDSELEELVRMSLDNCMEVFSDEGFLSHFEECEIAQDFREMDRGLSGKKDGL